VHRFRSLFNSIFMLTCRITIASAYSSLWIKLYSIRVKSFSEVVIIILFLIKFLKLQRTSHRSSSLVIFLVFQNCEVNLRRFLTGKKVDLPMNHAMILQPLNRFETLSIKTSSAVEI
jgi:hypothetical protein